MSWFTEGKKIVESEKYSMLKLEPDGAQSGLTRTCERPSLRQGCYAQHVV